MKRNKLVQEFENLKIENVKEIFGGTCNHPTHVENFPTSHRSEINMGGGTTYMDDPDAENQTWVDPDSCPDTIHEPTKPLA